jgi:hypothetical protein
MRVRKYFDPECDGCLANPRRFSVNEVASFDGVLFCHDAGFTGGHDPRGPAGHAGNDLDVFETQASLRACVIIARVLVTVMPLMANSNKFRWG